MSWYNEEKHGKMKAYLEWALGVKLEPEEEAGYFKPIKDSKFDHHSMTVEEYIESKKED